MKILTKKKADEILKRLTANEIIAVEIQMDAETHACMSENTAEIAYIVGGIKGMRKIRNTLERRYEEICNNL